MQQFKKLIDEQEIKEITKRLGALITEEYKNKDLLVLCIMNGSFVFTADLTREIKLHFPIAFLRASSYGDKMESDGNVDIAFKEGDLLKDKDVLVVEDIVDSGNTVVKVNQVLNQFKPKSIKWASLLSKPSRRVVDVDVDFIGKEIEDKFVVGYGLDFNEKYRNLPYIGIYQE